ncbi:MAG: class I SAM-dependent methyltransferase [Bdellovibrionota bacterium]
MNGDFMTREVGREYSDPPGAEPRIEVRPLPPFRWTPCAVEFAISRGGKTYRRPLWYAHLAMLKLIKHYDFRTVLDLGTNDGMASYIFDALGKDVAALEPAKPWQNHPDFPCREVDIEVDFLDVRFIRKFDAIWCSHVLEHIRNPGAFLDKVYDDLREGGVLALTVPFMNSALSLHSFVSGHHNLYNQWTLLNQLVCAGFDCRNASIATYNGQLSVVVKKVPNNITRSTCAVGYFPEELAKNGYDPKIHEPRLLQFFPIQKGEQHNDETTWINWGNPI